MAGDFNLLFHSKLDVQVRNPNMKRLQRRLDYIFISNTLQELVTTTEILTPISTDHCAVIFSLSKGNDCLRGKGFWKLNSSLAKYQNYITEIKILLRSFF